MSSFSETSHLSNVPKGLVHLIHSLKLKFFIFFAVLSAGVLLSLYYLFYQNNLRFLQSDFEQHLQQQVQALELRFNNTVTAPLQGIARFVRHYPQIESYLYASRLEKNYYRHELENLFMRLNQINQPLLLSLRLFDREGEEQLVVQGQKRSRHYQWKLLDKQQNNPSAYVQLFHNLYHQPQKKWLTSSFDAKQNHYLLGINIPDPLTQRFMGMVILKFDLSPFLNSLQNKDKAWVLLDQSRQVLAQNLTSENGFIPLPYLNHISSRQRQFIPVSQGYLWQLPLIFPGHQLANHFIVAGVNQHSLQDSITALNKSVWLVAGCTILLILALVTYISRAYLNPLLILSDQAKALAADQLSDRAVVVTRLDEIGEMQTAFNDMQYKLRQYIRNLEAARQEAGIETMKAKKAQVNLEILNQSLEQRVQERTLALEQAKDHAESVTEAKSIFLATMSHEIRTPMNALLGMISLVLDSQLQQGQQEKLSMAHHAGNALLVLLNDILDFSKIEAGKLSLNHEDFNVRQIVDEVTALFSPLATDKGLLLSSEVDPNLPMQINGDPLRLRQILNNLTSNAIKFTEQGKIQLRIFPQPDRIGDDLIRLQFSITDSGMGIPKSEQQQIFAHFYQQDGSSSRRHGGTGLGLALSKQLVECMNGTIHLESKVGVGSHFYFNMPFGVVKKLLNGVTKPTSPPQHLPKGQRILLVEDNKFNQVVAHGMLKKIGCQTQIAKHGQEALELLFRHDFDLILMDCQMPVMDGYETTKVIRQRPSPLKEIPIVAMTANAMQGDRENCLSVGMDDYLSKPVKIKVLEETLIKWLV